jgi:hypothetical protein
MMALLALSGVEGLVAGCGGERRAETPASTASPAEAALDASARGDIDGAEVLLRGATDPDAVRLRARFLLMKNRNREALDALNTLRPLKMKDYEEVERWRNVQPDMITAHVRLDDFLAASQIARALGDKVLQRKYETLGRGVAYSSNIGTDELPVELYVTDPLPIVAGSVNGIRCLFVIDTLLDEVVLDRDFARKAGVLPVGVSDEAVLPEISIGRLSVKNVPAHLGRAMELGQLRPEGAIGLQFLMHYDFTLDYRRSRLVFRRAGGTLAGQPAYVAGDRYLLLGGQINAGDRTFVGVGTSLKGVTLAVSEGVAGAELRELTAGPLKLLKPAVEPKAFPAGLDGSFGVPVGCILGHAALRTRTLRLEPRSMKIVIE